MKLLVCGTRDWTDREQIADVLARYASDKPVIIHGEAPGADTLAAAAATALGFEVRSFPPDNAQHGEDARRMRNIAMLEDEPDLVIAFHDGDSPGTQHTIDEARRRGIPVVVYRRRPG